MIYIVKTDDDTAVKIGFVGSKKGMSSRLIHLQVGNHRKLELVHLEHAPRVFEKKIHKLLRECRMPGGGEWFNLKWPFVKKFVDRAQTAGIHAAYWSIAGAKGIKRAVEKEVASRADEGFCYLPLTSCP